MEDKSCQKVDLNLDISIDLPANAPEGHLHLLNVKRPRNNPQPPKYKKRKSNQIEFPEDLSLVDVLATILFDWKPAALHHLLNVQNKQFYCAAAWTEYIVEYRPMENRIHLIPSERVEKCACKEIEKNMAQRMDQKYLADGILQDRIFPVLMYEPEAKSTKEQKSKATTTNELNDIGRESNTESSSDTLMEGNINARVTELESQVLVLQNSIKELIGPVRKRRLEGQSESVRGIDLEQK
ncbi:uncharacterized protein EAE97_006210 [Botrytis byssoidea]|uniref:Uncharacterized protein n=1 Tax=Botrytis byssoidea TaxID=139641 RepID=A0A9P5IL18_9HELO|nr:uncharacterized protein EAE97_006210 [Botrytis byssoidea]KAF7942756.1 hypothetical protein EAE97_006210 [Botrytis byssoidea]